MIALATLLCVLGALDAGDIDAPSPEPWLKTTLTGYVDTRFGYGHMGRETIIPTRDIANFNNLTEGNFQLRLQWRERAFVLADTSFFYQNAQLFYTANANGDYVRYKNHDVPGLRPTTTLSEVYLSYNFNDHANLTLGKKRIIWGPGFATNPTNLLTAPKDPTDPSFQRVGSWLARFEMPFDKFTFSLVGAAKVLRQYGGIPSALLYSPSYETYETAQAPSAFPSSRDDRAHFAAAARLYMLLFDTDINLMYFYTNLFNDAFEHKNRVGMSVSRYGSDSLELHAEALLQRGSGRLYANPSCSGSATELALCLNSGTLPYATSHTDDTQLTARVLVGGNWALTDNAMLVVEYNYNGDGYNQAQYNAYTDLLNQRQALQLQGVALPTISSSNQDPGIPQKFSFEPLRRHYLYVTYNHQRIHDDYAISAVLIANLVDASSQLSPQVTWSATEWLNLSAYLFIPIPGAGKHSEFALNPQDVRVLVSARAFY